MGTDERPVIPWLVGLTDSKPLPYNNRTVIYFLIILGHFCDAKYFKKYWTRFRPILMFTLPCHLKQPPNGIGNPLLVCSQCGPVSLASLSEPGFRVVLEELGYFQALGYSRL